ncbi:hypothetical protein Dsin_015021 [Dipteronia sinensis]|uniref:FAR1 domain-containing protein n=1 Tax=Dipteronia sinensis TaxID=43782 RepID=A0AAE0AMW4_9ROSI|nr:hypothetical protein Dsin_015021 [Dipteronia sinensis]
MIDMSEVGGLSGWDFDLNEEWTWDQTVHDDISSQTVHTSFVPSSSNIGDNPSTVLMPTNDVETSRLESSNPFLLKGLTTSDVVGKEFDSLEQPESFYFNYAKVMGFSVRKDEVRHNDKSCIKLCRWVCNKQGYRPKIWLEKFDRVREPRAIMREGCLASLHVNLQHDTRKWVIKEFVSEHSHQLASNYDTQFLRSHRNVNGSDVALAMSLRYVGVKTGQVMDFMVDQAGGYCNVGHTRKDLQNQINATRRSIIVDSDAESSIAYFFAKSEADPGFFFKYIVDDENRLCNRFLSDSKSRDDFHFFEQMFNASKTDIAYKEARPKLESLAIRLKELFSNEKTTTSVNETGIRNSDIIKDLVVVVTKRDGNHKSKKKRQRQCGKCKKVGNTIKTCRLAKTNYLSGASSNSVHLPNTSGGFGGSHDTNETTLNIIYMRPLEATNEASSSDYWSNSFSFNVDDQLPAATQNVSRSSEVDISISSRTTEQQGHHWWGFPSGN